MEKPFVDRTEEMKYLKEFLRYDGKECPVLVFTGIGGMGKTALRTAFEEKVLKSNRIPYTVLDYDGDPNLRSIEASLRAIRRQLGRNKIRTPVFDFLYARYFELSTGLKFSVKNCPPELESVATILDGIPTVGNITQIIYGLGQLGRNVKERVQHKKWLYSIRDLEPHEVLNLLPEVLAEDLEEAMSFQTPKVLKSSGFRISILLDAYELISESQVDDTLHRRLLLFTPHLLRVIFTRDPLPWERKFSKEWKGKIIHFSSLRVLSPEDTMLFLTKKNVVNPELQKHLFKLTGGYPFHLELCADICREITETTERKPEIQHFDGASQASDLTEELVQRLLRQLKDNEKDLMGLAVYPRWVSEEVLEVLSSVPESVPRIFQKLIRLSIFSPHSEIPEAYIIRKEIRDCLLLQERKKRLWEERHKKLSTFHRERWEETQLFHHLRETLYHSFYENPEKAMKIFEEHFWKLLERFCFAEAEGILEAVPVETLEEDAKKKVDYARARFLTSSIRSQQSLLTARNLYETLVTSETDEDSLSKYFFYLGELLYVMGEYKKALEFFQKSLAIFLKVCTDEHIDVAKNYISIGNVYFRQAEYEKALGSYHKSLAIRLKVYGEENPDVANTYHNIGIIYWQKGEYEKALEYYQKSLATHLKVHGKDHPDVADSFNNIGVIYKEQGEYEKALKYYQKSLTIFLKVYGEEHPYVAISYNNMGIIYKEQGEYEKAVEYYQKSLETHLKVYGEDHPAVATSNHNIGRFYREKGKYVKALEYHQKSLAIRLKVYGEEHPDVANSYNDIAYTLMALKREDEAFEKMRQSVEIYYRFCLWKDVVESLETLAEWLEEKGRRKDAEKARMKAKKIHRNHDIH